MRIEEWSRKMTTQIILQGIFSFLSFCILNSFERLVFLFFGVVSCKLCNILYFQYEYSLCNHIITELIFSCFVVLLLSAGDVIEPLRVAVWYQKIIPMPVSLNLSQNTNIIIVVLTFHVK